MGVPAGHCGQVKKGSKAGSGTDRDLSLDLTLSQVDIFVLFSQFYLV